MDTVKDGFFVDWNHAIRRTEEPGPDLTSIVKNCRVELVDAEGAVAFAADFYLTLDALVASVPSAKLHFVAAASTVDSKSAHQWGLSWIPAGIAVISVVLVLPPVFKVHNSILYPAVSGLLGVLAGIVCYALSRARRLVSPFVVLSLIVNVCIVLYMLFIWSVIYLMSHSAMH